MKGCHFIEELELKLMRDLDVSNIYTELRSTILEILEEKKQRKYVPSVPNAKLESKRMCSLRLSNKNRSAGYKYVTCIRLICLEL